MSNVGTYGITQGTLAASSNYTVSSFTGSNLTVT
ncbi:MBG domain-containing protein, partial [Bradyrhizobium lablabi]